MLPDYVHTFGQWLLAKHGERVHKIALDAGFTCPNRDGSKGIGGCTFCNNASFSPNGRQAAPLSEQLDSGRSGIDRCTRARKYLAYFQAYTNTYADVQSLRAMYDEALAVDGMIGLSVGTRPDCVSPAVLDLLAEYHDRGMEVWLELGLQSAFDESLEKVNRGHGLKEYIQTTVSARRLGIPVCTHLIVGMPGEDAWHSRESLDIVLDIGTDGLKLHPLHVVKGTQLANEWRRGEYQPLPLEEYIQIAADLIERTPWEVLYHRVTGTAPANLLLAPAWCSQKWPVVNAVVAELRRRGSRQGSKVSPYQKVTEEYACIA
ncbi:MAG: TIGR01212 family radical SAM protein [Pseudomonadota bacterium]|nr:TIGR01212 family radical SAM protein [Pseudomonadota bacterium]MDP1903428.1 TIGR01212 family radical SAM protein [Pseudomonadota bacterium]MDP2352135.1 TIGR01212 family radical SAM protein [Pseudomonadota bacterium]